MTSTAVGMSKSTRYRIKKRAHEDEGKTFKYCDECFSTDIMRELFINKQMKWDPAQGDWVDGTLEEDDEGESCSACHNYEIKQIVVGEPGYVYPGDRKAVMVGEYWGTEYLIAEDHTEYYLKEEPKGEINEGDLLVLEKYDHFRWLVVEA